MLQVQSQLGDHEDVLSGCQRRSPVQASRIERVREITGRVQIRLQSRLETTIWKKKKSRELKRNQATKIREQQNRST